jgi:uncharacterized protein YdeI (YjbR/CyaY-like superfamily)
MKVVFFPTSVDFRAWLEARHQNCTELWVGIHKKSSGRPSITYPEALDEALCFGWIDGVRKSLDADSYTQRFTPRKPKSQWSAINIGHVERLAKAGRMRAAGLKAFAGARDQSRNCFYEQPEKAGFNPENERHFRTQGKAWDFFQAQPPWYRRTATFWVISAKKEATRQKRLAILIGDSSRGQTIAPLTRQPTVRKRRKKTR